MKRVLLILVVIVFSLNANGQFILSATEKQIRDFLPSKNFKIEYDTISGMSIYFSGENYDTAKIMSYKDDEKIMVFLLGEYGKSYECFLYPKTEEVLNKYVTIYNRDYININSKEWKKYYTDGEILDVKLKTIKDVTRFIYEYEK